MKVLLLGAGGMLASDILTCKPSGADVVPRTHADLDVTDEEAVRRALEEAEPEVIVNCAAYTNVDEAESERNRAFAVNAEAPGIIGRAAQLAAHRSPLTAFVVHFSTDYVFGGSGSRPYHEGDPPEPVNAYGTSKLGGERALAESGAPHVIVRTSWLFGVHGKSFARTMWQRAAGRRATTVVNDQVGRPTFTVDLARAVWNVLRDRWSPRLAPGVRLAAMIHIANAGQASWYDVARRIFEAAEVPELVSPCTTAEYPTPATRPAYSVLDTTRFEQSTGSPLPSWQDAVDRFLEELRVD